MIWGPGSPDLPDGFKLVENDVIVVDGDHPQLWAHLFEAPLIIASAREALAADLRAFQLRQLDRLRKANAESQTRAELRRECWAEFCAGVRQANVEQRRRTAHRRRLTRRHGISPAQQPSTLIVATDTP